MAYIRLDRKFFQDKDWNQSRTFSPAEAWLDLIQTARFEVEPAQVLLPNGRRITVERGEVHASLRYLSARWGWSKGKVERFLVGHRTGHRTEQGETVLKLCNYDKYNPVSPPDEPPDETLNETPAGHRRDTGGTNNNKEKKEKKEKEVFVAPAREEVIAYFLKNEYTREAGGRAFDYYAETGWVDSHGQRVRNWKQKCIAVWFKPENKQQQQNETRERKYI